MADNQLVDRTIAALGIGRIAAGILTWISPRLTARLFGMAADDGQSHYAWRLFAIRDLVIGIGTLQSSGPLRRAFVTAGLACDVGDGAAGAIALSRGDFQRSSAGAPVTVPVLAVVLGAWVLRGLGR